ncbi:MAG: hypothetical protein JSS09_04775 [Verrucomicrobia bacterium]|nr:hypothetical protein [Verrucomicrobiota bacterium]
MEKRKRVLDLVLQGKMISVAAMRIFSLLVLINIVFSVTSPFFRRVQIAIFVVGFFLSREVFLLTKNAENILHSDGPFSNISTKMVSILNLNYFVNSIFKGTLIANPLFTPLLVEWLNQPKIDSKKTIDLLLNQFI